MNPLALVRSPVNTSGSFPANRISRPLWSCPSWFGPCGCPAPPGFGGPPPGFGGFPPGFGGPPPEFPGSLGGSPPGGPLFIPFLKACRTLVGSLLGFGASLVWVVSVLVWVVVAIALRFAWVVI